jgi:hypothetical protein
MEKYRKNGRGHIEVAMEVIQRQDTSRMHKKTYTKCTVQCTQENMIKVKIR